MHTPFFIAVGQDGLRLASADGLTWVDAQLGKEGETYRAAAAGNGWAVAVGSYGGDNVLAATAEGKTWKAGKLEAKYVRYLRGLTFGNGFFLGLGGDPGAVGSSKPFAMHSKDGLKWEGPFEVMGKHILRRAVWGNDRFVAVGDRGRRAFSRDGKEWKSTAEAKAIDTLIDIAYGNEIFVGVGLHGLRMASADGFTWSAPQRGEEGEHLNSVLFAHDRFVAVGAGATYLSRDGKSWERQPNENAPQVAAYGNGRFIGAAWKGRLLASNDGVNWKETHKAPRHIQAIAFAPI